MINLDKLSEDQELALELLKRENFRTDDCSEEELHVLGAVLSELRASGDSKILRQIYDIDFWREPPSIEEFCESEHFLGNVLAPDPVNDVPGLFPTWRKVLYKDFAPGETTHQIVLTGAIGLGKCNIRGTLITTDKGLRKIETLRRGDLAQTEHSGFQKIMEVFDEGVIPTAAVTTSHGHTMSGSAARHRIRVLDMADLTVGWKRVSDLLHEHVVLFQPAEFGADSLRPKVACALGWGVGDGSRTLVEKRFHYTINKRDAEEIHALVAAVGGRVVRTADDPGGGCLVVVDTSGLADMQVFEDMSRTYSYEKTIPPQITGRGDLCAFLKGYFSADGTAATGTLEATTTSRELSEQVRVALMSLGIYCGVSSKIPILNGVAHRRAWTVRVIGRASKTRFAREIGLSAYKQAQLEAQLRASANDDHWFGFMLEPEGLKTLRDMQPTYNAKRPHPQGLTKAHTPRGLIRRLKKQKCTVALLNRILDAGGELPPALEKVARGELLFDTVKGVTFGEEHCYDLSVENDPTYISNGIISHNTFMGCVAMLYKICFALCLRNPLLYYKLSKATQLTYSFFSVTQKLIQGGAFQDCVSMMRASPFFVERIKDNIQTKRFANRRIELAGNIVVEAGSQTHEALGRNTICSLIDEVNFRREKEAAESAQRMISAITRRLKSRFMRNEHSNPGLLVIISSANNETDFLNHHIVQHRNSPEVKVYDYPWWEVVGPVKMNPPYSGDTFAVDIGDQTAPPKILDDETEAGKVGHRIIRVPVEHRKDFEQDLEGAIRDIAGKATGRSAKFFGNIIPLLNSIKDELVNPMVAETIRLSTNSLHKIVDSVNIPLLTQMRGNARVPRRHSDAPRFIHLDMSSGAEDAMGFAMVHPVGIEHVHEFDYISGRRHELTKPIFEVDLAFRIVREDSNLPIDFGQVREFVYWIHQQRFRIKKVTADLLHMSTETLANLSQLGFDTQYVSMDRKLSHTGKLGPTGGYHTFRQCVAEGRFRTFAHNWMMLEIINLENTGEKIDHPLRWSTHWPGFNPHTDIASKDIADAVGGAIFVAEQHDESYIAMRQENVLERIMQIRGQPVTDDAPKDSILSL